MTPATAITASRMMITIAVAGRIRLEDKSVVIAARLCPEPSAHGNGPGNRCVGALCRGPRPTCERTPSPWGGLGGYPFTPWTNVP